MYPRPFVTMMVALFFIFALIGTGLYLIQGLFKREKPVENVEVQPNVLRDTTYSEEVQPEPGVNIPNIDMNVLGVTDGRQIVQAGKNQENYSSYTITTPTGWELSRGEEQNTDKLSLSKNDYVVQITQFATERTYCEFELQVIAPNPQTKFSHSAMFMGNDLNLYRRGWTQEEGEVSQEYVICEKTNDGFFFPTKYGYITATTPWPTDENIMTEIDEMLSTLQAS